MRLLTGRPVYPLDMAVEPMNTPSIDVAQAWADLGHRLRAYVARRVATGEADDIVQSVMVKLIERRGEIGPGSVRAWLFTVTRNAVAEYYRQHRPGIDLDSVGDIAEADNEDPADRTIGALTDCLEPMLRTLDESDADVLRRVDIEGVPQTALAESSGVPLSTLKSRVQRARTKLRTAFDACCRSDADHPSRRDAALPTCRDADHPSDRDADHPARRNCS
jgi:RNA polymerase sigma-70 factor (ECF subfamily)